MANRPIRVAAYPWLRCANFPMVGSRLAEIDLESVEEHLHGQGDEYHTHESFHGDQAPASKELAEPTRREENSRGGGPSEEQRNRQGGDAGLTRE